MNGETKVAGAMIQSHSIPAPIKIVQLIAVEGEYKDTPHVYALGSNGKAYHLGRQGWSGLPLLPQEWNDS